jgi:hypothetical protein
LIFKKANPQLKGNNMEITKDKLFGAIADLVEALLEYGCDHDSLIHTLTHYGFTKEQLKEWYGIGE